VQLLFSRCIPVAILSTLAKEISRAKVTNELKMTINTPPKRDLLILVISIVLQGKKKFLFYVPAFSVREKRLKPPMKYKNLNEGYLL
jgi:hypothetical protein